LKKSRLQINDINRLQAPSPRLLFNSGLGALATSIKAGSSNGGINPNSLAAFGALINLQKSVVSPMAQAGLQSSLKPGDSLSLLDKVGGSRSWRNNNPGNIEYGDFAKAHGAIGTDGRFARFPSEEAGTKAQENLLFDSKGYRNLDVSHAINKWAPKSENDTDAYIKNVTKGLPGVDGKTPMSSLSESQRQTFLQNMRQQEGWKEGVTKPAAQTLDTKAVSQNFQKDMTDANKQVSTTFSQDITKGIGGQSGVTGDITKLGDSVTKLGQDSQSATTGLSSLIGKLSGLGGGALGGAGTDASMTAGAFLEGGLSTSPVSSGSMPSSFWHGAPAYAEGTANTSGGGMPAILHPNEAVIPLSRGRAIPVEMKGGDQGGGTQNVTHIHNNIHAKDADSFKLNATQIQNGLSVAIGRARARNG
jgi:hypothetical protein